MKEPQQNQEIRQAAKSANVPLYKLAALFGISEWTFCRKMRVEFSESEKEKALSFIRELSGGDESNE